MGWILTEYVCTPCEERFESLEDRPAPVRVLHVACGNEAERVISAPHPVVASVKPTPVSRGKSDPLPSHRSVNTAPLADGMRRSEWRAQRRKMWREERYQQVKKVLG